MKFESFHRRLRRFSKTEVSKNIRDLKISRMRLSARRLCKTRILAGIKARESYKIRSDIGVNTVLHCLLVADQVLKHVRCNTDWYHNIDPIEQTIKIRITYTHIQMQSVDYEVFY